MIVKPGWQTTEFWHTLVSQITALAVFIGILPSDASTMEEAVTKLLAAAFTFLGNAGLVFAYIKSRTAIKTGHGSAKPPSAVLPTILLITGVILFLSGQPALARGDEGACKCSPCACKPCDCKPCDCKKSITEKIRENSVVVYVTNGQGSGTLYEHKGEIFCITADHVTTGEIYAKLRQADKEFYAVVVATHPAIDTAILKVGKGTFKPTTKFGKGNEAPAIDTPILHCGTPVLRGWVGPLERTILRGRIVALGLESPYGNRLHITNMDTRGGCSGGGIYLENGEYIGLHVQGDHSTYGGFIPIEDIRAVVNLP